MDGLDCADLTRARVVIDGADGVGARDVDVGDDRLRREDLGGALERRGSDRRAAFDDRVVRVLEKVHVKAIAAVSGYPSVKELEMGFELQRDEKLPEYTAVERQAGVDAGVGRQ